MKKAKSDNCVCVKEEDRWSKLPANLLWMIKDLLNIADSLRLAFVCNNWKSMSLSDPTKRRQQFDIPWLMHKSWDFVNVSTKERLTLEPSGYHASISDRDLITDILYSKQGWLLYRVYFSGSIILYNLHTNARIIMPGLPSKYETNYSITGCFSLDKDSPQNVVLAPIGGYYGATLYIASVDDKKWTKHSYGGESGPFIKLVVHGHKVYLMCRSKKLFSFDMANLLWKKFRLDTGQNSSYQCWLVESEGELVKIEQYMYSNTFSFFKLNDSQTSWEELSQNDLDNTSWFLHCDYRQAHQYCVKDHSRGGMKKVYKLTSYYDNNRRNNLPIIYIHDLINGSVQDYKLDQKGIWIDLGDTNKLPGSCISVGVVNT